MTGDQSMFIDFPFHVDEHALVAGHCAVTLACVDS